MRTQIYLDGVEIDAVWITSGMNGRGLWLEIEANSMPTFGRHRVGFVMPDGQGIEMECEAVAEPRPRLYVLDRW